MPKRPLSITIISWLFIVTGTIGFVAGLMPYAIMSSPQIAADFKGHWYVHLSRFLSIVSGVFMLSGFNWARWLLVVWLLFHIVVGALHSYVQFFTHALLAAVIIYFLFRPAASEYFRKRA